MKTLKEYIIKEDWETDLDHSKLHFSPKNEKELLETLHALSDAKYPGDITDWLVEAMFNYAENTDSNEVYWGRDIFDDVTGAWFKYSNNNYLIALQDRIAKQKVKDELRKEPSAFTDRVCLAYLWTGKCQIGIFLG